MYTRIFGRILDSSLNVQSVPPAYRWLFITMIIIGDEDQTGIIDMPVERLAARAGLSVEDTRAGLAFLMSPDTESSSQEEEGRRLVPIRDGDRGWQLTTWDKYNAIGNAEYNREKIRERVRNFRGRKKLSDGNAHVTSEALPVTQSNYSNQTKPKKNLKSNGSAVFDSLWGNYPRKRGLVKARQSFRSQIKTPEDLAAVTSAVANYRREIEILELEERFVLHGSTFFNGRWKDYADGAWTAPKPDPNKPPKFDRMTEKFDRTRPVV